MTHDILVPMLTGLFKRRLTNNLQTSVEKTIDTRAEALGATIANSLNTSKLPLPISFGSGKKQHHETVE